MRAAIVADGGTNVGLGHLSRCLALAQAIQRKHRIRPVFVHSDLGCRRWIQQKGFRTVPALRGRWDIIIADSYRFKEKDLRRLRSSCATLVMFDDSGRVNTPCDWVLNSSVAAQKMDYDDVEATGFLLGPKFHPLRKDYWRQRPRKTAERVKDVLVILGGGDGWGFLNPVVSLTRGVLPNANIHAIVGPLSQTRVDGFGKKVFVHRSPKSLRGLMERCDIAVSAGGQTMYELAFVGVPTVTIGLADNQRYNLAGFEAAGAAVSVGSPRHNDFTGNMERALIKLSRNVRLRSQMAKSGQRLVDGLGALRVADFLFKEAGYAKN